MKKLITIAVLGVSACTTVPSSPTAGPGQADADPALAAQIFSDLCLVPQPTFATTDQAAGKYALTKNTAVGTYYHNDQNLSVKLLGSPANQCSIVMVSRLDAAETLLRFGMTLRQINPTDESSVEIRTSSAPGNLNVVNARIRISQ